MEALLYVVLRAFDTAASLSRCPKAPHSAWGVLIDALMLVLIACPPVDATARTASAAARFDHSAWDRILAANVRDERVDYLAIRKGHWAELAAYLDRIAAFDPDGLPRDERLALYINLYNASMIRAVIKRFHAGYSPADNSFAVFDEPLVRVAGGTISLNHLENRIIRPQFNEPRIHAALVCAARSCPPLPPRAYRGDDLGQLLESNMRLFMNDASRNRVDVKRRRLELSQLFDWYAGDFGGKTQVARYVGRYLDADVSGFDVAFVIYSWQLNLARPLAGRWVEVSGDGAEFWSLPGGGQRLGFAARGEVFEVLEARADYLRVDRPPSGSDAWLRANLTTGYQPPP